LIALLEARNARPNDKSSPPKKLFLSVESDIYPPLCTCPFAPAMTADLTQIVLGKGASVSPYKRGSRFHGAHRSVLWLASSFLRRFAFTRPKKCAANIL